MDLITKGRGQPLTQTVYRGCRTHARAMLFHPDRQINSWRGER